MSLSAHPKLVTIFGGSGFLGRHLVRVLAARGYRVRVACRRPDLAGHLQPLGNVGQIQLVQANLRYQWSIDRAVQGADVVVNLVAILSESGKQKFDSVQSRGAGWVAQAAKSQGARLVHISAIGADAKSEIDYARTKGEAEKLVGEIDPEAIIMRPSIMFGPEDDFFNRFAAMAKMTPFLPLIGGGHTKFDVVYVGDVAEAVARAVDGKLASGSIWELGGPERLSFKELMDGLLEVIERRRLFIGIPFPIASLMGSVMQYLPGAPLTPGQVAMLRHDNVVSDAAKADGRTLQDIGIQGTSMDAILPTYLVRFRKHGQFQASRGL